MTVRDHRTRAKALLLSLLLSVMTLFLPVSALAVHAEEEGAGAPYQVYLEDYADLLTDAEEEELWEVMAEGTGSGNMVFMTIEDAEGYETKDYIEMIYQTTDYLNGTDAVIYMIDMDNRLLWITGYGADRKLITPDYGNLITDNVYRYARSDDFASSAIEGYRQIIRRLSGSRVSGALRGVGNLCIAVIIAEILCFVIAYATSAAKKTGDDEILDNIERMENLQNPNVKKTGRHKIYDPPKSSSSGGGRSGGGGGGGFHGGGGGHGF